MSYVGQAPVFGDFPFQILTGNGGTSYSLSYSVSNENGMLVFLNGAIQRPGIDYTAGGNSIVFASAVASGVQIFTYGMGLPKSTLSPSDGASIATPTQFDSSNKIATTAFVKRASGSKRGVVVLSANTTLTVDHVGTTVLCSGGGALTLTLPSSVALADGASIVIDGGSAASVSVVRQGTDTIEGTGLYSSATSIAVYPNESVELVLNKATGQFRVLNCSSRVVTPPQFDNDTSIATTEFVQRASGSMRSGVALTTSRSLGADDLGKILIANAGVNVTLSLPKPSDLGIPFGSCVTLATYQTGVITVSPSTGAIIAGPSGPISGINLAGGSVLLTVTSATTWFVTQTTFLDILPSFVNSLSSSSGYQRLPNGLIIQWGNGPSAASLAAGATTTGTATFPIAFPTGVLQAVIYNASWAINAVVDSSTTTSMSITMGNVSGGVGSGSCRWIVLGY